MQQVLINPSKIKLFTPFLLCFALWFGYLFVGGVEDVRCSVLRVEKLPASSASLRWIYISNIVFCLKQQGRGCKRHQLTYNVWRVLRAGKSLCWKKWKKCCFSVWGGLLHIVLIHNVLQNDLPLPRPCFCGLNCVVASKAGHDAKALCCFQSLFSLLFSFFFCFFFILVSKMNLLRIWPAVSVSPRVV